MNESANLSCREKEVAELLAWGASKKEVADHLFIAESTVANHAQSIYLKTGCGKAAELSAWWFCHRFRIPLSLSPLYRGIVACLFLMIYLQGSFYELPDHRGVGTSSRRCISCLVRRKNDNPIKISAA